MNKFIYALATVLVLGTTGALAGNGNGPGQGDGSCVGNCPQTGTGGGTNEQSQEQTQGQRQSSTNVNRNTNSADAASLSVSGSTSGASSNATGGSVRNHVGVKTGPTTSSSTSSAEGGAGGNARAYGGTGGVGVGGSASNGGNSTGDIEIEGDTFINEGDDVAASSAASVFAGECQSGMSGQVESGGFAVVNPDQFCQSVKAARVALQAYEWELQNGSSTCVDVEYGYVTPEGQDVVVGALQEVCVNEKANEYLAEYRHHTDEAIDLVRSTETVGFFDTVAGYLVRPVALISVLILLL